jgi:NAD-dependent deacetylase sirtuin 7
MDQEDINLNLETETCSSSTSSTIETSSNSNSTSSSSLGLILRTRSGRCVKSYNLEEAQKRQRQNQINRLKIILNKQESQRSEEEKELLVGLNDLVEHIDLCKTRRLLAKSHKEIHIDPMDIIEEKCKELAKLLTDAKGQTVIYTGAGISTSASIPDYRGPNGLWTLLEKGIKIKAPDFARVKPSFSHMAIKSLVDSGLVKHVVSQNCDGLHLRSSLDREKLSELHGNCFIEFCLECYEEYTRLFDTTENSSFRKHTTGRFCKNCKLNSKKDVELRDSIIHFGEKLRNGSPYNWDLAKEALRDAELIICFGSSLKVLKHYSCLWPKRKNLQLWIVNIQWTPKDTQAKVKINGYTDKVFELLIKYLNDNRIKNQRILKVEQYTFKNDPIFDLAVELDQNELHTTSKSMINRNEVVEENHHPTASSSSNSWYNRSFKNKKIKDDSNESKNSCGIMNSTIG